MLGFNTACFEGARPKLSEDEKGHFAGIVWPVVAFARLQISLLGARVKRTLDEINATDML